MNTNTYKQSMIYSHSQHDDNNINWTQVQQKPKETYLAQNPEDFRERSAKNPSHYNDQNNFMYMCHNPWTPNGISNPNVSFNNPYTLQNYKAQPFQETFLVFPTEGYINPYYNPHNSQLFLNNSTYPNQYNSGNFVTPQPSEWISLPQSNQWVPHPNSNQWIPPLQTNKWVPYPISNQQGLQNYNKVYHEFHEKAYSKNNMMRYSNPEILHSHQNSDENQKYLNSTKITRAQISTDPKKLHINQNKTISNQNCSNDSLKFNNGNKTNRKVLVRTPFIRQKEIDKLKDQENVADVKEDKIRDIITEPDIFPNYPNFNEIVPNVRETTGGWNTQSNDVIEERIRQRREQFAENEKNKLEESSMSESYVTASTDDSFKTALSFEEMKDFKQSLEKKINDETQNLNDFKKNALIIGLLKTANEFEYDLEEKYDSDEDELWIDCTSNNIKETNKSIEPEDIVKNIEKLVIKGEECDVDEDTLMRGDRLQRFLFQSEEDEDVYVHPLREKIAKDKEWRSEPLSRQGTKVVYTSRHYYLNIPDEDFNFTIPIKEKSN